MEYKNVCLLDCTLRDGGYINDWAWGNKQSREIIRSLTNAGVDVIEVGFLRDVEMYDKNVPVCNTVEELNDFLPETRLGAMYCAMAMCSNYDVSKLSAYSGTGIEMIRITAHDYDIKEGLAFAREIQSRGYKVSINPINIMGYSDKEVLWIIDQVNQIMPYQFSIVDTFGSMKRRDLDRLIGLVDHNLNRDIRVGLHLHENMALSFSLAQRFLDSHLERGITVDASLMGIGRIPGNLPIELIADYMNDYCGKRYDLNAMMDAIQDYIQPLRDTSTWGYTPTYFLSAKYNLHRNYAEFFLNKGVLTTSQINQILSQFDPVKATVFDASYAQQMFESYQNNQIDDSTDLKVLRRAFARKDVLLIAPGTTIGTHAAEIETYIKNNPQMQVVSINFVPEELAVQFAFFANSNRINRAQQKNRMYKVIATSNLRDVDIDIRVNYNALIGAFDEVSNGLIMMLKLLEKMDVHRIYIAGADGYVISGDNYFDGAMRSTIKHGEKYNAAVAEILSKLNLSITFITPSRYDMQ